MFSPLILPCPGCDQACVGCMGSGPARCKKCARGYRLKGAKCLGKQTLYLAHTFVHRRLPLDFLLMYFDCLSLLPCTDVDECNERAIACPGLNEACINEEGSFHCDCADGFIRRDSICVENKPPGE